MSLQEWHRPVTNASGQIVGATAFPVYIIGADVTLDYRTFQDLAYRAGWSSHPPMLTGRADP